MVRDLTLFDRGRSFCFIGQDGSLRWRLIVSRWYVDVTVFGFWIAIGWM